MSVVDKIQHYQRNIVKCSDNVERMMHCISKLYSLPVTVQHLQETGVGRTVNALRKYDGDVGEAAKALVAKWKTMVADEESSDGDYEDEGCALDPPEDNDENSNSSKIDADDAKELGHSSHETKQRHTNKLDRNKSSKESSKNSSMDSSKTKDKSHSSSGNDRHKHSKVDKEKREHKYESRSEKKSKKSRDSKNEKHRSRSDELGRDVVKVSNSSVSSKNEDVHRKRRLDSSSSERESSKKRKASETEIADLETPLSPVEDNGNDILPSLSDESNSEEEEMPNAEIKQEPPSPPIKNRELAEKSEERSERKSSKEKGRDSSSKSRSSSLSEKSKRDEDKDKKKNNTLDDHRKSEKRKDESYRSSKEISKSKNHPSSSSSKDKIKDKEKDKEDKHKEKHKSKKESKHGKDPKDVKVNFKEPKEKKKVKQEINGDEGIDCNSGASFAEALGMCTMPLPSRKRNNNSPNLSPTKVIKTEPSTSSSVTNIPSMNIKTEAPCVVDPHQPSLLAPNVKLEPLSVDLASTLPEINPNYKPLPYVNPIHRKQEEDRALSEVIYAKNQRTKVYSGNKSTYTNVPSLYEMCIRILIENIEALEFTGGVPYDIIKPVLERATADQLFMLEHHNPYLIEDTDPLWQFHCSREFRCKQREEMETWREMYMRCLDEREAKLKALTANIKQSIDKSLPVRSAKLAYVDNVVKPPRHVLRKQAKYGTATATPSSTSDLKKKLIAGGGSNSATNISVPPPPMPRSKTSSGVLKKTKAPLMAKALQLIKGRYKR
ncbi:transcription elongation factor B polypeptide 3 isoform X2 [Cephus cinctus]|uniref:Transcription elongation factor B polypeptide 3 isoform X2 n=1 Tax=Cephus cinctus TaxID=211228 RepID=A0AAJ7FC92_CEPCN|nr:transcription elongation factor B polypeptide 3 isoform X2 [Cephus cinctus]